MMNKYKIKAALMCYAETKEGTQSACFTCGENGFCKDIADVVWRWKIKQKAKENNKGESLPLD